MRMWAEGMEMTHLCCSGPWRARSELRQANTCPLPATLVAGTKYVCACAGMDHAAAKRDGHNKEST